jgi:hypothetical protein
MTHKKSNTSEERQKNENLTHKLGIHKRKPKELKYDT